MAKVPFNPFSFTWPVLSDEERLAHKGEVLLYDPEKGTVIGYGRDIGTLLQEFHDYDGMRSFMDVPPPEGKCQQCFVHAGTIKQADWHLNETGYSWCKCCSVQRELDHALDQEARIAALMIEEQQARATCG